MKEIKAIIQPFMLEKVCDALAQIDGLPGITVSEIVGWGKARAVSARLSIHLHGMTFAKKVKLEVVVPDEMANPVVETIEQAARTGNVGDGKVFVYDVRNVVKIRTGDRGKDAI